MRCCTVFTHHSCADSECNGKDPDTLHYTAESSILWPEQRMMDIMRQHSWKSYHTKRCNIKGWYSQLIHVIPQCNSPAIFGPDWLSLAVLDGAASCLSFDCFWRQYHPWNWNTHPYQCSTSRQVAFYSMSRVKKMVKTQRCSSEDFIFVLYWET